MKKILLATTVLAMSAGFAVAEVAVSGSARMGVVSTDGASTFSSRVRMTFTGSGTTDGGLAFGGSFAAHDTAGANAGTAGSTYISGAFGKIAMGGVDSGDAAAVGQLASVGYTGLGSGNSINYVADGTSADGLFNTTANSVVSDNVADAGGAKVLYTYSANGLTVAVSSSQLSNTAADHSAFGLGASYTTGALTVALGYGTNDVNVDGISLENTAGTALVSYDDFDGSITDTSASVKYVMGSTTVKAIYQNKELDVTRVGATSLTTDATETASATSMGVSVSHKIDAITLTGYTVSTDIETSMTSNTATVSRYGVGVGYDLGGGASFNAGWAKIDAAAMSERTYAAGAAVAGAFTETSASAFDVGVNFSF